MDKNCKEVGKKRERSMARTLKWCTVSSVTLCKITPPPPIDTVFVSNMESVAAYNQKRQIVAAVFPLRVPTLFFWGDTRDREREREGWMNGEKAHHLTTPQALMETCRLPGDRSTHSLRLPWEPGGTWRVERTRRRLCLYPGLNALRIDTSAWPKKKKGKAGGDLNLSCLHPSSSLWSWNVLLLSLQSQFLQKKEKGRK